ncbi:CDP-alcohol phosphatidyltransferase family protein [Chitinophaga nivalis]|uniref:CDP-alcohol phosphatidyltransferase family protein n=1 Tax=Chitinophaga nivalis TaxID=2991709 RepID=A0ABT3ISM5_9BACT|nr:CDP-alcohol phosphatidyltransferase family protein [Chitinophaga nivalis]MCW3463332.1 CDP-alcohol phosphatidyltransferase family protein [Chitinophaga nivalis]MCW3486978.1 CDP-alcohol phosphatidyltransferase family protein [Chitinophaga nivalis]
MRQIPNIITLCNLFCGALAIICTLHAPEFRAEFNGVDYTIVNPEPIYWASALVVLAAIFDFFDGLAARLLRVQSPMGKELDSLADMVTFGVVPGMMLYRLLRSAYFQQPDVFDVSVFNLAPALLVPCFAAYRLAKFNLDTRQSENFIGVPTPAVGLLVASFPLIILFNPFNLGHWFQHIWVLYGIIAALCYLMVAELPMISLKFKNKNIVDNWPRFLLILLTLVGIPVLKFATVPFIFVVYVALSIVFPPKITISTNA